MGNELGYFLLTKSRVDIRLAVSVLVMVFALPVLAAIDQQAVHKSMVRVMANGNAASGFVYGHESNQIVTALHAILPRTNDIKITCRGNEADVVVKKVMRKADLVLLEVVGESLEALGCKSIDGLNTATPDLGVDLYAFGFRPDNSRSAFSKQLTKASGDPENLDTLIPDKARRKMKALAMPDVLLPIYYVNGGVYPGYSGGPVFNTRGELVGVVQGGLDKGTANHDWLIPAGNISEMLASADTTELPDIDPSEYGYSAPAAVQDDSNYISKQSDSFGYTWVKMKTRNIDDIYETADPAEGIDQLLDNILPDVETDAERKLNFDIYQELDRGLIIAVPEGQLLEYEEIEGDWFLVAASASNASDGHAQFSVKHIEGDTNEIVSPAGDDSFFTSWMDDQLTSCEQSNLDCSMDEALTRIVDYGGGDKILRWGYQMEDTSDGSRLYFYETVAIRGNQILLVQVAVNFSDGSPVPACFESQTHEACGDAYWSTAAFMLAGQLTSFSRLGIEDNGPITITTFDYDCDNCDAGSGASAEATQGQGLEPVNSAEEDYAVTGTAIEADAVLASYYYSNGTPAFQHLQDDDWFINIDGEAASAIEIRREVWDDSATYAILQYGNVWYAVPIVGGQYYTFVNGGQWTPAFAVYPQ